MNYVLKICRCQIYAEQYQVIFCSKMYEDMVLYLACVTLRTTIFYVALIQVILKMQRLRITHQDVLDVRHAKFLVAMSCLAWLQVYVGHYMQLKSAKLEPRTFRGSKRGSNRAGKYSLPQHVTFSGLNLRLRQPIIVNNMQAK